jgi:sigma-E factor negative regulatory protein RseB
MRATRVMHVRHSIHLLLVLWTAAGASAALAQTAGSEPARAAAQTPALPGDKDMGAWLKRMQEAPRRRAYAGTYVVSSSAGALSSARIWHVCDGSQQLERVEALTGAPRSTFRRNDEVLTFRADEKTVVAEKREAPGLFPNRQIVGDKVIAEFYTLQAAGSERVAGHDADVVQLVPRDALRYGYRVWSEKKTGLVVKLQTIDGSGRVLEQSAFSELQLNAPVKMDQLARMMAGTSGYRVEKAEVIATTAGAEGWSIRHAVPGFLPTTCLKRQISPGQVGPGMLQWVFSDGLASVSLFVEGFDPQRHRREGMSALGATQSLTKHLADRSEGDWWLTVVGEVPAQTLQAFAQGLERRK